LDSLLEEQSRTINTLASKNAALEIEVRIPDGYTRSGLEVDRAWWAKTFVIREA
jgi:hypothetical protein